MKSIVSEIVTIIGASCISASAFMVYLPAGWFVSGVWILIIGVGMRKEEQKK